MFKSRLITALILIPIVIAALFLLPQAGFTILVLVISMLAAWEWGQFAGLAGRQQRIWVALIFGLIITLMLFSLPSYQPLLSLPLITYSLWISLSWWAVALILVLSYPYSTPLWQHSRALRLIFGLFTLVPFFWSMLVLRRYHFETEPYAGAWWLLFVMLLVWGADSGAYFCGKLWGKHKLAPRVSPGKTIEGMLGGLATSALIAVCFSLLVPFAVSGRVLVLCAVIATLASILGDLTESMFKREAGIKDSGTLIPGHGGMLDRIDSLTAAVPVFTCMLLLVCKVY